MVVVVVIISTVLTNVILEIGDIGLFKIIGCYAAPAA